MKLTTALILINEGVEPPFAYHQLIGAARMGTVPVELNPAGTRWTVRPENIPALKEAMLATRQAKCAQP